MTPTIVLEDGVPVLALGGSGGQRIATEVTQAALCRLVFARDPSACVSLPRMHVAMSGELFVERDVPEDVREGLKKRGEPVKDELPVAPAVQMISVSDARDPARRTLRAAADPRKGGLASAR
jgi:gamma-glutamyltranspeptidase/glutathione hydrolase